MTSRRTPADGKLSRRTTLGLLGIAPLAVGGAAVLADNASASPRSAATPPGNLGPGGAFDKFVAGLAAQDLFSGTVLLAWHGDPVLVRSYQMADKALHIPNGPDTIFNLASVTKMFTGVAVAQLAAAGAVDYSATVGTYLAGFPVAIANTVTVHQLLTHTSGVPEFELSPAWQQQFPTWQTDTEAFNGTLSVLQQLPLAFTPGTQYSYSNSNYFLAGAIVAHASGLNYWDYVPRRVFGPAGMTSTAFYSGQQYLTDPRIAHNYGPKEADGQRQDITSSVARGPDGWDGAGGAFSSALDLLRFARALQDGTLLPRAWSDLMTSGKFPIGAAEHNPDEPPSQSTLVSYGTEERIVGSQRAYGHTGGLLIRVAGQTQPGGGSTSVTVYPDLDVVAIVLSNYFLYPGIGGFLTEQDRIITHHAS